MRKLDLGNLSQGVAILRTLLSDADHEIQHEVEKFSLVPAHFCKRAREDIKRSKSNIEDFELTVSLSQLDDLYNFSTMSRKPTYDAYSYRLTSILSVIITELSTKSAFIADINDVRYIFPDEPVFGRDVERAFPSASFDIEEAATCYGLGRDTASAFHLMRAVEIGLRAVSASLGLPDPVGSGRNWGQMNGAIKAECDRRTSASSWSDVSDKSFYNEVYASIDAVRAAWRNATMHVEQRYTHDEAEQIFAVTKGFLRKLSERMDESGSPSSL